ncbi:HlyD family efflux transporter periplasmic adaptor subunit [Pseudomonas asplenii]|uniref:HlyD family secretion protein n=1 Tax=Pseudomonas asplenii TaxID=53407 RepID=A0A1H6NVF8_9PSED|nr:HlyD family efflux transporter periplasmic adaptor subunit [Pseudomonas fuscovaginae]SEI16685.1 HlyD family secretion protein [Pseudomonas fuscovaginae]
MNLRSFSLCFVLLACTCLLVGCPRDEAAPQSVSAAPAQVAVARGRIDVEGGLLKLGVSRDGVVSDITVREGQHVRKGQLLASLDSELARLAVSAAQTEQQQVQLQARQLEKQASFAELKAKRLAKAAAAGAGDGQSADDAREAAQQLRYAIETNRTQAAVAARKLTAARYELEQRNLRAPVEAEVVRRLIQPGATVSPQSGPAFVLLPSEERIVRAELNESFTGVVVPGMKAEITDDSGSGLPPLSARVQRIGAVFGNSTLEEDPLIRGNTRTVECVLVFDKPAPASLRIGQRMLVRFGVESQAVHVADQKSRVF